MFINCFQTGATAPEAKKGDESQVEKDEKITEVEVTNEEETAVLTQDSKSVSIDGETYWGVRIDAKPLSSFSTQSHMILNEHFFFKLQAKVVAPTQTEPIKEKDIKDEVDFAL